jgi:hypothetical protein
MLQPWDLLIEAARGTKNQITRTVLLRPQLFSGSEFPVTCANFSRFIRFKTDLCDPEFMFWYLQHIYYAGFVHAYHTQHTGVARFQWTTFSEREPLELPSLAVQRRIAGILSAYDELMANSRRRIRRGVQKPLSGAWMTPGTLITPDHEKCPQSERKARKNKRISSTNSSGSSSAAKWPPRDISVQCWILYPRSTHRLGGSGASFGKRAIPHGTVT